jgi:hypothetical protein
MTLIIAVTEPRTAGKHNYSGRNNRVNAREKSTEIACAIRVPNVKHQGFPEKYTITKIIANSINTVKCLKNLKI